MLRFAQIGLGKRGQTWAGLLREHPAAEAVAYIDNRLDEVKQWAAEAGHGAVPCFDDLGEALQATRPDATSPSISISMFPIMC